MLSEHTTPAPQPVARPTLSLEPPLTSPLVTTVVGPHHFPEEVRSLTTLANVDYADLFLARTTSAGDLAAEGWARAVLEETPLARASAYRLWRLLGLRLAPRGSDGHVEGWRIADQGSDWIRIETRSWYMHAEAVFAVRPDEVRLGLSLQYDLPVAAAVWAAVGPMHRRGVPPMLRQAVSARGEAGR